MSDTPSTDALYEAIDGKPGSIQFGEMFGHARQLERELAAARAECEALRRAVDEMMAPLGYYGTISAKDDRVLAVMDALAAMREGKPTVREEG